MEENNNEKISVSGADLLKDVVADEKAAKTAPKDTEKDKKDKDKKKDKKEKKTKDKNYQNSGHILFIKNSLFSPCESGKIEKM